MNETEIRRRAGGRSARVRHAVLDATLDLVHERGLDALTVAEAASRAGVHETSIYRRWGTRENLMIDALLGDAEERLPVPDTGTLRADLITYATALARYLSTPAGVALDRALASANDDPATRRLRDQYWDARIALSGQIVQRAIQRGELPETTDPRFVLELLVAPLHFKVVLTPRTARPRPTRTPRRRGTPRTHRNRRKQLARLDRDRLACPRVAPTRRPTPRRTPRNNRRRCPAAAR